MASLNRIQLIGNAGADPRVVTFENGNKLTEVRLGVTESYTDRSGQRQSTTEWFSVIFNGNSASTAEKYIRKGSQIYVDGRLKTRTYTDNQGQQRTSLEVSCLNLVLLGRPDQQGAPQPLPQPQRPAMPMPTAPQTRPAAQPMPQPQYQQAPPQYGPQPQYAQQQAAPTPQPTPQPVQQFQGYQQPIPAPTDDMPF